MTIAARLYQERQRHNLNQAQAAQLAGIAYRTWQTYENGQRVPNADVLAKLYQGGFDVLYIVTGARNPAMLSPQDSALLNALHQVDERTRHALVSGVLSAVQAYLPPRE